MITKFEVSNYKSVKTLSIEMQPFMVLVGPNGAGKTNIVRALELLGNILRGGTTEPASEQGWGELVHRAKKPARGGLKLAAELVLPPFDGKPKVKARVAVSLRRKAADHDITVASEEFSLTSDKSQILLRWSEGHHELDFGTDPALWAMITWPFPGTSLKEAEKRFHGLLGHQVELFARDPTELQLLTRRLGWVYQRLAGQCAITRLRLDASALRSDARFQVPGSFALGPSGEGLPVAVDRLRGRKTVPNEKFVGILNALREVYPRIEDVVPEGFGQGRVTLNFHERGITQPIPLDGVSDGVLHALALLIALRPRSAGVLAIEEPENALHPWSVRKIMDRAQTAIGQVLITTHSETVVNAVKYPKSLFIVEADEQGTTVQPATSQETALSTILKETGQKLGEVWIDGSLGGVPRQ